MRKRGLVAFVALRGGGGGHRQSSAAAPRFSVGYSTEHAALGGARARARHPRPPRPGLARRRGARRRGRRSASPRGSPACPGSAPSSRWPRVSPAPSPACGRARNGLPLEWAVRGHARGHGAARSCAPPARSRSRWSTPAPTSPRRTSRRRPRRDSTSTRHTADVSDLNGHGTFVASIAAGSATNGEGIAGFGGAARLLVVKAVSAGGVQRRRRGDRDRLRRRSRRPDHQPQPRRAPRPPRPSATPSPTRRATVRCSSRPPATTHRTATRSSIRPPSSSRSARTGSAGSASPSAPRRRRRPCPLLELRLVPLARRAGRRRARRALLGPAPFGAFQPVGLPGSARALRLASGTSFAAPQVAGAAALVWAANPLPLRRGRRHDPQADRLRRRLLDAGARLRRRSTSPPPSRARRACRRSRSTACAPEQPCV